MKRAFKYDVAISAADFDALTAEELKRRLEHRLAKGVYIAPKAGDKPRTSANTAAIHKSIEKDSRVVVVLFQRLWGITPADATEIAAIKARVGNVKRKDVVIVPIDTAPIPSWLKGVTLK